MKLGGRMDDRDYKQRTPLQVAAELGKVIYWIKALGGTPRKIG